MFGLVSCQRNDLLTTLLAHKRRSPLRSLGSAPFPGSIVLEFLKFLKSGIREAISLPICVRGLRGGNLSHRTSRPQDHYQEQCEWRGKEQGRKKKRWRIVKDEEAAGTEWRRFFVTAHGSCLQLFSFTASRSPLTTCPSFPFVSPRDP